MKVSNILKTTSFFSGFKGNNMMVACRVNLVVHPNKTQWFKQFWLDSQNFSVDALV